MQEPEKTASVLLQGDETRRVRRTDTGTTVLDRLAVETVSHSPRDKSAPCRARNIGFNVLRDRELSQVVANHLRLDLDLVELLSGVDANDASDHLGDDNHVTEVSLDEVGLLVGLGLLLGLAELLDQTHGLALEATVDTSAGTGMDDITELVGRKVEEPVERVTLLATIHLWNRGFLRRARGGSFVCVKSSSMCFLESQAKHRGNMYRVHRSSG